MKTKLMKSDAYERLLANIRKELSALEALFKNRTLLANHKIGGYIWGDILKNKDRANYGKQLYSRLSRDLNVNQRTLYYCVEFYKTYPILHFNAKLTWTHFVHLLTVKDASQRKLLEDRALRNNWDSEELYQHIQSLKQRQSKPKHEEIPQLSFTRGRLNTYKIIKSQEDNFIDLGFQIRCRGVWPAASPRGEPYAPTLQPDDCIEVIQNGEDYSINKISIIKDQLYTYKASVEEIIDGDTLWVIIDLSAICLWQNGETSPSTFGEMAGGFEIFIRQKLRLRGIDCPEIDTPQGQRAKKFVQERLKDLSFIIVKTYKDQSDKYDRYLTDIFYTKEETDPQKVADTGNFLNQELLDMGLAKKV